MQTLTSLRETGYWIIRRVDHSHYHYFCNNCNFKSKYHKSIFCPNCGFRMTGEFREYGKDER